MAIPNIPLEAYDSCALHREQPRDEDDQQGPDSESHCRASAQSFSIEPCKLSVPPTHGLRRSHAAAGVSTRRQRRVWASWGRGCSTRASATLRTMSSTLRTSRCRRGMLSGLWANRLLPSTSTTTGQGPHPMSPRPAARPTCSREFFGDSLGQYGVCRNLWASFGWRKQ